MININIDKQNPILMRCNILQQYASFVEMVRQNIADDIEDPFAGAINMAIDLGVLSDYLERKSTEIRNMLLAEYDYDTDIAVQRKEAFDDGIQQGELQKAIDTAKNFLSMGLSIEQIAQGTGLTKSEVEQLAQEMQSVTTTN